MMNKNGATPIFCAPEQIEKPEVEKTDVHAFGITILFVFYTFNSAMKLLFLSKKDLEKSDVVSINNCEIVKLTKEMTVFEAKKRMTLEEVKTRLKKLNEFSSRKNPVFATPNLGVMMNTLKISLNSVEWSHNSLFRNISYNSHQQLISSEIHDQKESHLCWSFALCTVLTSELRNLVDKLFTKKNIRDQYVKKLLLTMINKLNLAENLKNELLFLVVPRNSKLTGSNINFQAQASTISGAIEKLSYESVIRDAGWKRMPSIVDIFTILGNGLTC